VLKPVAMDHIVLRCADVETTLAWYCDELGLVPVRLDEWRAGEVFFPSARISRDTIIDFIGRSDTDNGAGGALDHLCIVVDPVDLEEVARSGRFTVVDGPDIRYGARGDGASLYVVDPDGVTVEIRHYG
jgi:catechol 2,3-dioxygenase-like lactoylglutathione lyase family enzyme